MTSTTTPATATTTSKPIKAIKPIRVFINGKLVAKVASTREAWRIIGKAPFGSLYEVHDENGVM